MNASQLISIFSLITGLYTLWNSLNLSEKIVLWFGTEDKQYLEIYHKLAFWN